MYDRIVLKLRERGISAGAMCNQLGIRRAMMTELKTGATKNLSAEKIAIIAGFLHCSCDYLILGSEPHSDLTLQEQTLLSAWRLASDKERENVAFILRDHGFAFSSTPEAATSETKLA